jgi:type II secretory pathway pseudopilin PulG
MKLVLIKALNKNSGLTLVEVLIATMIIILFIGISLQALTIAAVFQSRAKVQNDAINWIEEDLEKVREKASAIAPNPTKCQVNNPNDGYAKQLQNNLPVINTSNEIREIAGLNYKIVRTPTIIGTGTCEVNACYEILHLNYQVKMEERNVLVTEIDTEVIPDAAFQCRL